MTEQLTWCRTGHRFVEGTAVAVSAVSGGYLVAVRPRDAEPGEPPPPTVLDVALIDPAGNTTDLTQLPLGATSPSFAGHLVSPSTPPYPLL